MAKQRSNCPAIMSYVVEDKLVPEEDSASLLGVEWDHKNDMFRFKVRRRTQPDVVSKRLMTSEAARIYDPMGWVSPVTIDAKWFIQEWWRKQNDWDAPLPEDLQKRRKRYYDEIQTLDQVQVPRWLGSSTSAKMQVHVYCDALTKGYGAAAYVRAKTSNGWRARLLFSRSRIAPIKAVTIPRLELLAVGVGSTILQCKSYGPFRCWRIQKRFCGPIRRLYSTGSHEAAVPW